MSDPTGRLSVLNIKLAGFLLTLVGCGFSISFCSAGLGIYIAGFILELALDKTRVRLRYPQTAFLLPLLASLLISLFISHYFKISLRGFWKFIEGFVLVYAAVDLIRTPKELRLVISVLAGVFFMAALAGVWQDISGRDFIYFRPAINTAKDLPPRLTGPFKHYNDYATFLVPGFAFSLALFIHAFSQKLSRQAFFSGLLLLALTYAVTRSLSRSAMVAIFISLGFFSMFFRYRRAAFTGLLVLAIALWVIPSPISSRFKDIFSGSTPERIILFKTSAAMIKAKPFFGLGLNTYSQYFPEFRPKDYPSLMYAHNSYMQMASEIGLIGLFFYLLFIGALLWASARSIVSCRSSEWKIVNIGVFCGVIGLLINAFFESLLQSSQLRAFFWSLLGISCAVALNLLPKNTSTAPSKL